MKYEEIKKIKKFEVRSTKKRNFSNLYTSYFPLKARLAKGGRLQRGVAIYLAVIVMFVLLGIGLGLSTLLVGKIKSIERVGNSVTAFYAADTGIERELFEVRIFPGTAKTLGASYSGFLDIDGGGAPTAGVCPDALEPSYLGDACYKVTITSDSPYTVESIGIYKGVRRAVEVNWSLAGPPVDPCKTPAEYTVFVSSVGYTGGELGPSGGVTDGLCQSLAENATPPLPGQYTAWVSFSGTDEPRDPPRGLSVCAAEGANSASWHLPDGTLIANDWVDLTDGTIAAAISQDEISGTVLIATWTGTDEFGSFLTPNCVSWTSSGSSDSGWFGFTNQTDLKWTKWTSGASCDNPLRIYCFQHSE
ncbi:pilus assembly PilX N-terminal domain-containing protein [Patescibacteria group bacterium]|nr:pilus assembly PilX N-terminal domain-containing protein [Patescibacteria group bacterium]